MDNRKLLQDYLKNLQLINKAVIDLEDILTAKRQEVFVLKGDIYDLEQRLKLLKDNVWTEYHKGDDQLG